MDIEVGRVFRREDARKTDPSTVRGLMESIRDVGIINPLRVRPARRHVDGVLADAYEVTAGGHRLAAALKLGLETVPCIVVGDDDLHAELAMIDENLCRAELSEAERAHGSARRKEIYLVLHPETGHGSPGVSRQVGDTRDRSDVVPFVAATAKATGRSERAVQRDTERGEKIAADVLDKIKNTRLDTGVYLDTLKKLGPNEQRTRVLRDLAQPAERPVKRAPAPLNDAETEQDWLVAIMRVWNRGSKEWREAFLAQIDTSVMDRRFGS